MSTDDHEARTETLVRAVCDRLHVLDDSDEACKDMDAAVASVRALDAARQQAEIEQDMRRLAHLGECERYEIRINKAERRVAELEKERAALDAARQNMEAQRDAADHAARKAHQRANDAEARVAALEKERDKANACALRMIYNAEDEATENQRLRELQIAAERHRMTPKEREWLESSFKWMATDAVHALRAYLKRTEGP